MKKQSQNHKSVGQNAHDLRKSQKHEVNLQKNSTLYFQIGLILCLLGTFTLFEMRFESSEIKVVKSQPDDDLIEYAMNEVVEYQPKVELPKPIVIPTTIIDEVQVVDNTAAIPEAQDLVTEKKPVVTDKPFVKVEDVAPVDPPIDDDIFVGDVQFVPIFSGCENYKLNSERHKCLNDKIERLVQKKFDTDIATEYGLSGIQRIYVQFKVDKTGNITDISTRAPHPNLEEEAERLANRIPKMEPGIMIFNLKC